MLAHQTAPVNGSPSMNSRTSRPGTKWPMRRISHLRSMPCVVAHLLAHHFAQRLDVERVGLAEIEEEIGVHFAHLRAAKREPAAAGGIDQLPARMALGVLEGRAAGLGPRRLRRLALFGDLAHPLEDIVRLAGEALIDCRGEHRAARPVRLAVEIAHIGIAQRHDLAVAGHRAQLDHALAASRCHSSRHSCRARRRCRLECRDRR